MSRLAVLTLRERLFVLIGSLAALTLGSTLTIAAVGVMTAAQAAGQTGRAAGGQVLAAAAGEYLLGLMTMVVGFVAVFVVAATASFAAALRRRELALLRAVGATPGQIRRLVLREAALLALVGGAVGAFAAPVTARILVAWLSARGMVPGGLHLAIKPIAVPFGCLFMLCVALAGTWPTARRCGRVRPTEALLEAAVDRGVMTTTRWLCGGPCLALAAYLMLRIAGGGAQGQLAVTFTEAVLVIVGLTMVAPVVVPRVCTIVLIPGLGVGRLARWHSRTAVRRTAALATPVLLVVGLAASFGTVIDSVQAGVRTRVADPTDSSNMNPAALAMLVDVTLAYAAVSLAGIAAMATAARAPELVRLRFSGATRAQIVGLVALEALVATLVGAGLGVASVAAGAVGLLHHGSAHGGGVVVIPWGLLAEVTAVCAGVAMTACATVAARGPAGSGHLAAGASA